MDVFENLHVFVSLCGVLIVTFAIVLAYFLRNNETEEDPPTESWLDSDPFVLANRAIDRHVLFLRSLQRTSADSLAREASYNYDMLVDGLNEILALVPQANDERDEVLFERPSDTDTDPEPDAVDESLDLETHLDIDIGPGTVHDRGPGFMIQPDIDTGHGTVLDIGPGLMIDATAVALSGSDNGGGSNPLMSSDSTETDDDDDDDEDDDDLDDDKVVHRGYDHKDAGAQHSDLAGVDKQIESNNGGSCDTTSQTEKDDCIEETCDVGSQKSESDHSKNFSDYCVYRRGSIFLQKMQSWAEQAKIAEELHLKAKHDARVRNSIFLQKIRRWEEQSKSAAESATGNEAKKFVDSEICSSLDGLNSNSCLTDEDLNGKKSENDSSGLRLIVEEEDKEDMCKEGGLTSIEDIRKESRDASTSNLDKLNGCLIFLLAGGIVCFCLCRAMRN